MEFSPLQSAIFTHITNNRNDSLLVESTAGSGKTTTLVECAKRMPAGLALAFNKAIATELTERIPPTFDAKTFHACAFRTVKTAFPRRTLTTTGGRKHRDWEPLARIIGRNNDRDIRATLSVLDYAREIGVGLPSPFPPNTEETWETLLLEQSLTLPKRLDALILNLSDIFHHSQFEQEDDLRFGDMIYLCLSKNLPLRTYKNILVDEAQDLSLPQIAFLKKLCTGRIVAFGDPHQSIYGFRGSYPNAMKELQGAFDATTLPLSTSYRCSHEVTTTAREQSPQMRAHESNPQGEVFTRDGYLTPEIVSTSFTQKGSLAVLCRNNAPLIRAALRYIAAGLPVSVRSTLQYQLKNILEFDLKASTASNTHELHDRLAFYMQKERDAAEERGALRRVDSLNDLEAALTSIIDSLKSPSDYKKRLDDLFKSSDGTVFSTIHRAKGLEWDNVIIYEPNLIPSSFASTPDDIQQEYNMLFVAKTRARHGLAFWHEEER